MGILNVRSSVIPATLCSSFEKYPSCGIGPSPREHLAVVSVTLPGYGDDIIYFFGGTDESGGYLTNIFSYDANSKTFASVETNGDLTTPQRKNFAYFVHGTKFYLWGGQGPLGLSNDMFVFDCQENTWTELTQATRPSPRQGSHFAYNSGKFYIFGGRDFNGNQNDVWEWDVTNGEWTQVECDSSSSSPEGRTGGGAYLSTDFLYIFGGMTISGKYEQDMYRLNLSVTPKTWQKCKIVDELGTEMTVKARIEATVATFETKAYVYSGFDFSTQTCSLNDIVVYDFSSSDSSSDGNVVATVYPITQSGYWRRLCGLLVMKDPAAPTEVVMFMFGGDRNGAVLGDMARVKFLTTATSQGTSNNQQNTIETELTNKISDPLLQMPKRKSTPILYSPVMANSHGSNGASLAFTQMADSLPEFPLPRSHHRALLYKNRMWIYGGIGEGGVLMNDMHSFDFNTKRWSAAGIAAESLEGPAVSDFAFCEHAGRLFVYGGYGKNEETGITEVKDELWSYSTLTKNWMRIDPLDDFRCPGLVNAAAVVLHKCIYVVGGYTGAASSNEIWRFSLVTLKWMKIGAAYLPSTQFNMANNPPLFVKPTTSNAKKENEIKSNQLLYKLIARNGPAIHKETRMIDGNEWDVLVIGGGMSEFTLPLNVIDVVLLDRTLEEPSFHADTENMTVTYAFYSDPVSLGITDTEPSPLLLNSLTLETEHGFIAIGGVEEEDTQNFISFVDLQNLNAPVVYNQHEVNAVEMPKVTGAAGVYYGRTIFTFGGMIIGRNVPTSQQPHNQMMIYVLDSSFACSLGTYRTRQGGLSEVCGLCPIGSFNKFWNADSCTVCRPGSFAGTFGSTSPYHCLACPTGTYNDEAGAGTCKQCRTSATSNRLVSLRSNAGYVNSSDAAFTSSYSYTSSNDVFSKDASAQYCPVGSTTNTDDFPPEPQDDVQPPFYETLDSWSFYIMVICYASGICIGLAMGVVVCCCPCRKKMYVIDAFTDANPEHYDKLLHKSPKILRKSKVGSYVTVTFICFLFCAAAVIVVEFVANNITENKSLISSAMYSKAKLKESSIDYIEFLFKMYDMHATCVQGVQNVSESTGWGKCADTLLINSRGFFDLNGNNPFTTECRQTPSSHIYHNTVAHCEIRMKAGLSRMNFPDVGFDPQITISSTENEAHAFAIYASMTVDTGIQFKKESDRLSFHSLYGKTSNGDVIKGKDPARIKFSIIPSRFVDQEDNTHQGAQILKTEFDLGTTSSNENMFEEYGLNLEVNFEKDINILQTTWVQREKPFSFYANLLSNLMGFMGIFSVVVWGLQEFMDFDLGISKWMRIHFWGESGVDDEEHNRTVEPIISKKQSASEMSASSPSSPLVLPGQSPAPLSRSQEANSTTALLAASESLVSFGHSQPNSLASSASPSPRHHSRLHSSSEMDPLGSSQTLY
ncbi:uncharacterized protein MONOS_8023 [Monocercomonoides exilis]|uniref:uncharacterized protein n=1 Tax=Monocercomonoides exilis TaxID=2049356 RepID=UPI003559E64C|nr:hypothetical protein MONOS_8023 [Monocercomonoides exilis]|eukprot:MONOS_8023.1-p1 / transcript=MONOS_8023.1 / gene=MONOS_8023 / organism=Monocercomonoides_exilis_PA203 / gene_product=unspecified product / transcript_product=unspecified product / location=Mono_scaffold00291:41255-45742(+) / protein_length=1426 / sequence_SO=supercontig / SO=protein_coding / is_pseudo=false